MTEQKTYKYKSHTMDYSVDDTSFFKYSTTIQLGNKEEDYIFLAANTEKELIKDFQERVDQFLCLKQQLVDEIMILENFVKQKFNDSELNTYLKTRLILVKEQLRKLTNEF